MLKTIKSLFVAGLLAGFFASCATSPTGRSQLLIVSPEAAIQRSALTYAEMVDSAASSDKLLNDPALAERVGAITGRLVARAVEVWPHTAGWNWSVMLIDDPDTPNAFCTAGGLMGVYSGLVSRLDLNDDELAQVMGHEIGHAIANHTAEKMSMSAVQRIAVLAVGLETEDRDLADLTNSLTLLGVLLPNSRTAEREADQIGMELAVQAGYDPAAGESVWQKFADLPGDSPPEFLSTHPSRESRGDRLKQLAQQYRGQAPANPPEPYPVTVHWDSGTN